MPLLDVRGLEELMLEFRGSMRGLLRDLCRDFERNYAEPARTLHLPIEWFRMIERSLGQAEFSHWKVVGWIESLNDLLYFVDILHQVRQERSRRDVAEQLARSSRRSFMNMDMPMRYSRTGRPNLADFSLASLDFADDWRGK